MDANSIPEILTWEYVQKIRETPFQGLPIAPLRSAIAGKLGKGAATFLTQISHFVKNYLY